MKTKIIITLISLFALTNFMKAQNSCAVNLSLMNESARNGQFAEAYGPWKEVFEECPGENLAIYQRGASILQWKLVNAAQNGDAVAYNEYFELLMNMYDKRIEHFGTNQSSPTPRVLGMKAIDYINFKQGDELKKQAYEWLKQSVDGMNEAADLEVLRQYITLSTKIFQAEPAHAIDYINDYQKAADILTVQAGNEGTRAELAAQIKQELDDMFLRSGAANCETLDAIYAEGVKENLQNLEYLNEAMAFYRRIRCTEQEVYFMAAVAAHRIEPTAESALGCYQMSMKRNEFSKAIEYLEEATRLSTSNSDKSDYQYTIAVINQQRLNNFSRARTHAQRALEFNPSNGRAHLLIGVMYGSTRGLYDDPVLNKTVFWAAVDRLNRARQADSSVAAEADRMIRSYSQHFPTREEIFFHRELNTIGEGGGFTVGGWINERTTVRAAQ